MKRYCCIDVKDEVEVDVDLNEIDLKNWLWLRGFDFVALI
jgi:hypothetical protein